MSMGSVSSRSEQFFIKPTLMCAHGPTQGCDMAFRILK